jgi:hypothetical protein
MDEPAFDGLVRSLSSSPTRRSLLRLLTSLPLGALLAIPVSEEPTDARRRKAHRHQARHQHRQAKTQRRREQRKDAHGEACIPTGQRCPSRKPRGKKKGKKLSCRHCCQGTAVTAAGGKQVCGCLPNGQSCTDATACCSGFCNGTACQAAPCSAAIPCPACQRCGSDGLCALLADGTACDDGNACTQSDTCQGGRCVGTTPVVCPPPAGQCHDAGTCDPTNGTCTYPTLAPDGTSCDGGNVCCGGNCVQCCSNTNCSGTTPICSAAHTCVACTNSTQCPANQICLISGACHACDVTCTGTPAECGQSLQTKMNDGGTVHVCPGTYRPPVNLGFVPPAAGVGLIGAGEGSVPASNTVLDAQMAGRVMNIPDAGVGEVVLQRLRVTGGRFLAVGAGIRHNGTALRMTECTVASNTCTANFAGGLFVGDARTLEMTRCTVRDNHAPASTRHGGGIYTNGPTTLTDCLIEVNRANTSGGGIRVNQGLTKLAGMTQVQGNHADAGPSSAGGGIYLNGGTLEIAESCRVTLNTATAENGGGIFNDVGPSAVTLGGGTPSPTVVDNCHENCAPMGAVANCSTAPPDFTCP